MKLSYLHKHLIGLIENIWSLSIPPGNIRKEVFREDRERTTAEMG